MKEKREMPWMGLAIFAGGVIGLVWLHFIQTNNDWQSLPFKTKTSELFRQRVAAIAKSLGIQPLWLMKIMAFETGGSFSPTIRNPRSKAVGLIQFTATTAKALGTSLDALAALTQEEQLYYVLRYFLIHKAQGRMFSLADAYCAVFAPKYITHPLSAILYTAPSDEYEQNRELDKDRKGFITKSDIASVVEAVRVVA